MQKVEQWSILLGFLQDLEENKPVTISEIHKNTKLHFNTIKDNLKTFQSIQEFQFLLKVIEAKRQFFVIKVPNIDDIELLNMKMDKLLKEFKLIKKRIFK